MHRRTFLKSSGAALGYSLLPISASARSSESSHVKGPAIVAELEKVMPKLMEESVVPGVSVALVKDGTLLWRRVFGVKDSATKEPVDHDTVFEAASISKTVFAYAALKLCESGVIGLDTPLAKYLTDPIVANDPRWERITPRHALSHTSGFQNWRGEEELKIHFPPGERFSYSGEGYFYLQSVITRLKGRVDSSDCAKYERDLEVCATDFEDYMKGNLLAPFGMTSSGYIWRESFENNTARPHDTAGKSSPKKRSRAPDVARYGSSGALHTTATDYAKFLIEVLEPKPSDAFRLSRKVRDEMIRPQIKLPEGEKIDGADSWALGWAVQERPRGHVILHSGGNTGFSCLTMASPQRKSGFIIMTNSDNGGKVFNSQPFGAVVNRLLDGTD
jgi:CubicO group peptidase (beta-lactamase class C family)